MAPEAGARPEMVAENWDSVAAMYDQHIVPATALYGAKALEVLPAGPGQHIIDIAAGSGAFSVQAAARGARVTAIDFSARLVELLRQRVQEEGHREVEAHVMDGQALRFPDATFDAAYSVFGLMLFPDRRTGWREMLRVVRPGGRGLAVSWDAPPNNEWMGCFGEALQKALPDAPPPAQPPFMELADPRRLCSEMEEAGWQDVDVHTVSCTPQWPDATQCWRAIAESNPAFPDLIRQVGEENAPSIRAAFEALVGERAGDGPVRLVARAHIGVGTKED